MTKPVGKNLAIAVLAIVFATATGSLFIKSALAATGSIYLTPANNSLQTGQTETVSLRINPSSGVSGIQATVNFDTTKLQYVSADTSASAFSVQLQQTQSGGTVNISRGDFNAGGVAGDSLVETITFKALAGSGSSALTLTNANATDSTTSNYTNPSTSGASISFTTPATAPATCPSGQTGTPPNCTTPSTGGSSSSSSSNSSGSSKAPAASGSSSQASSGATTNTSTTQPASKPAGSTPASVTSKAVGYTSAVITSTSKDPTTVYIRYGTGGLLNLQTPVSELATTHAVSLDPSQLIPGVTYSYVVVSTNQQGVTSQTAPANFTTTGLKVTVGVFDSNHKPLRNQIVTLHSTPVTAKTDNNGFVTFSDVAPGTHHVIYAAGKKSYDEPVSVINNVVTNGTGQTASPQNFSVVYSFNQADSHMTGLVWISVIVLVIAAIVVLGQTGRLGVALQFHKQTGAPLTTQPIVVGGSISSAPTIAAQETGATTRTAIDINEHLSSISEPPRPQPGSTITPKEPTESDANDTNR